MAILNLKLGQHVSLLDSNEKGIIKSIQGGRAEVEMEDGFTENFPINKLVPVYHHDLLTIQIEDKHIEQHIFQREPKIYEIDLHIENIDFNWKKLDPNKILDRQISHFWEEFHNSKDQYDKMIVIHGKGKGILKNQLIDEINRYPQYLIEHLDYGKYKNAAFEISFNHP